MDCCYYNNGLSGSIKCGYVLTSLGTVGFSRRTVLHAVSVTRNVCYFAGCPHVCAIRQCHCKEVCDRVDLGLLRVETSESVSSSNLGRIFMLFPSALCMWRYIRNMA